MIKRIVVSVSNDLATDQRVEKVCNTLHNNGFEILLIGRKLPDSFPLKRPYKTKRISLISSNGFLFYAEFNIRLFFILLFQKKSFLLANDLDTLLPNYLVSKLQSVKLVYDSHELFSEIPELVHRPFVKKCWVLLEKLLLPKLEVAYTVCDSIADYYHKKYQTNFTTIFNYPTKKMVQLGSFSFNTQEKQLILYQGAVNIGRGLELMLSVMKFLPNHIFVIIGEGDVYRDIQKQIIDLNLGNQVFFTGKLTPQELAKLTPLANVGISLEEDLGLNYRYALPNKIFDYIQAEVPVLVSDLPEMKQLVLKYNVGVVATNRTPKAIAAQIEKIDKSQFSVPLKKAKDKLIWECQEQKLVTLFT